MAIRSEELGKAHISPNSHVIAGGMGSWTLTVEIGKHGIDDGGSVIICRRDVSDWERPQFDRPLESGYVTATTSGNVVLDVKYDPERYIRPWRAALVVTVKDGSLAEGDTIGVHLGDRSQGGPGMRAQTFPESRHVFKVMVDAFGTGLYYDVPDSPAVKIVGGYPAELHAVTPSTATVGEPFSLGLRITDSWGNPSVVFTGTVKIKEMDGVRLPTRSITFGPANRGVGVVEGITITNPGTYRIEVESEGLTAASNPIRCLAASESSPTSSLVWGDLHGQTGITIGTGTVDEYFTFARRVAFLDFTGWQGNDFQITPEGWQDVVTQAKRHHDPGKFVVFPGYEWSGLTPHGGDYNIHYLTDDPPLHRSSHWEVDQAEDIETDRYPVSELWETLAGRNDVFAVPHVGGRHANLDFMDERFSPVIEVHSHHGTFEWMIDDAFARGYQVGFSGGSDDHTCRPGLSYPTLGASRGLVTFDVFGGYTAVFAGEKSREAIKEALFKRHCYATTGVRILMDVRSGEHMMGDAFSHSGPLRLTASVHATAPLLEVQVFRGSDMIHRAPVRRPANPADRRILVLWSGVRVRSRSKKTRWNGTLSVDNGYFREAQAVAFDRADEGITLHSNQLITFDSTTSGDIDGVRLDVPSTGATLRFSCPHVQFDIDADKVGWQPVVFDAGGVNQKVTVCETSATAGPLEYALEFEESELPAGVTPYWIRVIQEDGHMAWSSPMYVSNPG